MFGFTLYTCFLFFFYIWDQACESSVISGSLGTYGAVSWDLTDMAELCLLKGLSYVDVNRYSCISIRNWLLNLNWNYQFASRIP